MITAYSLGSSSGMKMLSTKVNNKNLGWNVITIVSPKCSYSLRCMLEYFAYVYSVAAVSTNFLLWVIILMSSFIT